LVVASDYEYKKIFGVIGYPISHSLSPIIHNWGFKLFNLPYVYFKWSIDPCKLPEFIVSVDTLNIGGFSVTIPFKEKIIPYLDEVTDEATAVGAVNLVYVNENKKIGHNTDVDGFLAPIKDIDVDSALILGCGGAALACIYGLKKNKIESITVAGRNKDKLNWVKKRFNVEIIDWDLRDKPNADLLINCTPIGMSSYKDENPYPDKDGLSRFQLVYDVVYNPLETKLIKDAKNLGIKVIPGIYMFIYQALFQFQIWTNKTFDVNEAINLLRQYL